MHRRPAVRVATVAVLAVSLTAACASTASGPRMKVCGVWIGAGDDGGAGGGPYWVDLTAADPPTAVQQYGAPQNTAASGTSFKVSKSCTAGAIVTATPDRAATVTIEAKASDGNAAEVFVALLPGHDSVAIQAVEPGNRAVTVTMTRSAPPPTAH